jgi:hypothetical protein
MFRSALSVLFLTLVSLGLTHGAVPEVPEAYSSEARLFALDNRPQHARLLALDLPRGQVVAELSLPPRGMSLVATPSGRYLLVGPGPGHRPAVAHRGLDRQGGGTLEPAGHR